MFLVILLILSNSIYAKYNYNYVFEAFSLNRDISEIVYKIEKDVPDGTYTNKDVTLRIVANKKIEEVEGFNLDESGMTLSKVFSENETNKIVLNDLSGNQKEISYEINNIDKVPPEIIGIEDGITYNTKKDIEYKDNVGIYEIKAERYSSNMSVRCMPDYYDTYFYEGLDILGEKIYLDVTEHPKGAKKYKFYINNELKAVSEKSEYTYTGLKQGTSYTLKVEALDKDGKIIESLTRNVKTKYYKGFKGERNGNIFKATITGIASNLYVEKVQLWNQNSETNRVTTYPKIDSNGNLQISYNAYDVDGKICNGYYYFHVVLFDKTTNKHIDTICINVMFGEHFVKTDDDNIDPYKLYKSGNYELIVTDLAGNVTKKNITIKL